jgi:DNA-directed RNA polymerase subunit RPC12/RpoP
MTDQIKGRRPRVPVEPGQRFGDWIVLEAHPNIRLANGKLALRCECSICGRVVDVAKGNLLRGQSLRCRPCSSRRTRACTPELIDRMVVKGAINRLPQIGSDHLDELIAAALAERERREVDW